LSFSLLVGAAGATDDAERVVVVVVSVLVDVVLCCYRRESRADLILDCGQIRLGVQSPCRGHASGLRAAGWVERR